MTGEKNSPTAEHADRKRRPKCVAGAWGFAGLTLQVGGWATDRQADNLLP